MLTRLMNWFFTPKKSTATLDSTNPSDNIGPTNADLLGAFQSQIKTREAGFLKELEDWKRHRELEFSTISKELKYLEKHDPALEHKVKGIFSRLLATIKQSLEPANLAIDDLMANSKPHLDELETHLRELCEILEKNKDHEMNDELKKVRIDMCDTSILLLNELIILLNDILSYIEYCLKSERFTEAVATEVFDILIKIILGVPVPEFNINLNDAYRDFLYKEIKDEKEALELCETELEGNLQKAEKLLERPIPQASSNPSTLFARSAESKNTAAPEVAISIPSSLQ